MPSSVYITSKGKTNLAARRDNHRQVFCKKYEKQQDFIINNPLPLNQPLNAEEYEPELYR